MFTKTNIMNDIFNYLKPVFCFSVSGIAHFLNENIGTIGFYLSVFYTGFKIYQDIIKPKIKKKK